MNDFTNKIKLWKKEMEYLYRKPSLGSKDSHYCILNEFIDEERRIFAIMSWENFVPTSAIGSRDLAVYIFYEWSFTVLRFNKVQDNYDGGKRSLNQYRFNKIESIKIQDNMVFLRLSGKREETGIKEYKLKLDSIYTIAIKSGFFNPHDVAVEYREKKVIGCISK